MSDKIKSENQLSGINEMLKKKNIANLRDNAIEVFEKGETSLEEIYPFLI